MCRQDYDAFFQRRPALSTLLRGLLLNQHFLFVGYSLRDPNFQQIFGEVAAMLRDAQRPAFATTFEQTTKVPDWLPSSAPLTLLGIHGASLVDQERRFLLWLDELSERVLAEAPTPFLAPDASPSTAMGQVRRRLLELGAEIEKICLVPAAEDVLLLARLLEYLTDHGWRSERTYLCDLWQRLAMGATSDLTRRRCLAAALRHAETAGQKQSILRLVAK